MAIFRKIHTSFWGDSFVQELTPEQKYFFLYLLTNEKTTQCGIYEISKRQICYDTGYNIDTVSKLLNFFQEQGKIMYSSETNEIALKNWNKFNSSDSTTVKTLVNQQLRLVKNTLLIEYLYSVDTYSTIEEEQEKEIEQAKNNKINIDFSVFWDLYDKKVGEKSKLEKKWIKLKDEDRAKIILHIPKYKMAQPNKKYRKNPETYLNNKSWNDEIISTGSLTVSKPNQPYF